MGNSISCFDPVREHPPYSWPKDHPGRAEAIEKARRKRKNHKIIGMQGGAHTIDKNVTQPADPVPLDQPAQSPVDLQSQAVSTTPIIDVSESVEKDAFVTSIADERAANADAQATAAVAGVTAGFTATDDTKDNVEDKVYNTAKAIPQAEVEETLTEPEIQSDQITDEAVGAVETTTGNLGVESETIQTTADSIESTDDTATASVTSAEAATAGVVDSAFDDEFKKTEEKKDVEADMQAAAVVGTTVEEGSEAAGKAVEAVTDEDGDAVDDTADAAVTATAGAVGSRSDMSETEAKEIGDDEVIDNDIGIAATPVDEALNGDGDSDDGVVERVEDERAVAEMEAEMEAKMDAEIQAQLGTVSGPTLVRDDGPSIDTRRAVFDQAEDHLPQVTEVRRDILDPVTNENISLEEYRKKKLEQTQGMVRERVEKFEEIDEERSKQRAEHAAIEKARTKTINQAKWTFKEKTKEDMENEGGENGISTSMETSVTDATGVEAVVTPEASSPVSTSGLESETMVVVDEAKDSVSETVEAAGEQTRDRVMGASESVTESVDVSGAVEAVTTSGGEQVTPTVSAVPVAVSPALAPEPMDAGMDNILAGLLPPKELGDKEREGIPELPKTRLYNAEVGEEE